MAKKFASNVAILAVRQTEVPMIFSASPNPGCQKSPSSFPTTPTPATPPHPPTLRTRSTPSTHPTLNALHTPSTHPASLR
ncbi:hypothetical protein, partial [Geofilum rubicundum]|uniref:hypothetical protein n=1 Tax=Geofilum rubicundum TaxID=472113 RepID=UPI001D0DFD7F